MSLTDHGTTNSGSALHSQYSMTSFGTAFMYGPIFTTTPAAFLPLSCRTKSSSQPLPL